MESRIWGEGEISGLSEEANQARKYLMSPAYRKEPEGWRRVGNNPV